jgi:hypothetical protein
MTSLTSNCARLRAFSAIEDDSLLRGGGAGANEVVCRILRNLLKNFCACLNAAPTAMAGYF